MAFADVVSWTCIFSLYVGFASLQGLLARAGRRGGVARLHPAAAAAFAPAVLLPASILVLSMPGLALPPRLAALALGGVVAATAYQQPRWLPSWIGSPSFGRLYLGITMALAALWGLLLTAPTAPSSLIGAASVAACLLAVAPATRRGRATHVFEVE